MLREVDQFLWVLRREGFEISPAQAIDAVRALEVVGFDPTATEDALACVLVERAADRDLFRRIYQEYFTSGHADFGDLWSRLRTRGFSDYELAVLGEILDALVSAGEGSALQPLLVSSRDLDALLVSGKVKRTLAGMTGPLASGYFDQKLQERLGFGRAQGELRAIELALRAALVPERAAALAAELTQELARARRRVRHVVDRTTRKMAEPARSRDDRESRSFLALSDSDAEEIRVAVRALAYRLKGAVRSRSRHAGRRRIDPHRTLRLSFKTWGVPIKLARRSKRSRKPELVVLCDVSQSVRTVSRFLLEFVIAAQDLFQKTRSYIFVSELAEITLLLSSLAPGEALSRIHSGTVVPLSTNSNYGRVFRTFAQRFGGGLNRRVTLVVLGDGRTNYLPDEIATLQTLRARCDSLLWICPEGPELWGTGDSAMGRYRTACTKVLFARNAYELEIAAREVVARRK